MDKKQFENLSFKEKMELLKKCDNSEMDKFQ